MKPLQIFGEPDPRAVEQIQNCLRDERAVAGALMADNHLGYAMPIGGVVAYEDAISPTGVGFDIGCGNKAVRTNLNLFSFGVLESSNEDGEMVADPKVLRPLMREIQKTISFGVGRRNLTPIEHPVLEDDLWKEIDRQFGKELYAKARDQLGTVGSGNHYVDILVDQSGYIWVACHFGSRGLGHTIASGFMAVSAGKRFTDRIPESEDSIVLSTKTDLGIFYVEAMRLAGEYAYAGRDYVVDQVLQILGAEPQRVVHNHHNYAWLENGQWVVRKGATPLNRQDAFIGGSMGDISVIVREKLELYPETFADHYPSVPDLGHLGSAPHGAGRVMSRTKAAGKFRKMWACQGRNCDWFSRAEPGVARKVFGGAALDKCPNCGGKEFRKVNMRDPESAAIDWGVEHTKLSRRGIVVLGAGADESPGVYKDLSTVLAAHPNIEVMDVLRPIGVVMAGEDVRDPYKD